MTTIAMLQGTATGFKRAIDLIKALNDLDKSVNINAVTIELQQIILDAQAAQFALVDRVRELEAEVTGLQTWEAEKQKYKLDTIAPGVFAYALKEECGSTEPFHYACQKCYQHKKIIVLQKEIRGEFMGNTDVYACNECGAKLVDHESWKRSNEEMKTAARRPK
jgi:DNA-directed RNA polymerase subunit M/transcription elongation factor TFIIS